MAGATDELGELRDEIDRLDDRIGELVSERVRVAERVAQVKTREGTDLVDENREEDVKSHYENLFERNDLDGENGRDLTERLIEISLEQEQEIKGNP